MTEASMDIHPETTSDRKRRLVLMGEFSAGKSTLTNILLDKTPLPMRVTATRLPPVQISYGKPAAFAIGYNGESTEIALDKISDVPFDETLMVNVYMESDVLQLCDLVDMPGISDPNMRQDIWENIIEPDDMQIVSGFTRVSLGAFDTVGVADIVLSVDGVPFATDTAKPYRFTINTSKLAVGVHTLTAVGTDMARDARYFRLATRICAELGAQYIKSYYIEEGFETVTASCPVPIVMAGGKKIPELDALTMAYNAIQQGASGVDMGRNIFQSDSPVAMLQAVRAVVHDNETPEKALDLYNTLKNQG